MNKRYNQIVQISSHQKMFRLIMNHEWIVLWSSSKRFEPAERFIYLRDIENIHRASSPFLSHTNTHIQIFFIVFNCASVLLFFSFFLFLLIFMKYAGMFSGKAYGMALFKNKELLETSWCRKTNRLCMQMTDLCIFQNVNRKLSKENWHSPFSSIVICKFHYKTEYSNTKLFYNVVYTAPYSYIWLCNVSTTVIILYLLSNPPMTDGNNYIKQTDLRQYFCRKESQDAGQSLVGYWLVKMWGHSRKVLTEEPWRFVLMFSVCCCVNHQMCSSRDRSWSHSQLIDWRCLRFVAFYNFAFL